MGRGRAKAKQAKVARELKYQTGNTSIEGLREELGASPTPTIDADDDAAEYYDPYDEGDDDYSDEEDEESHTSEHH